MEDGGSYNNNSSSSSGTNHANQQAALPPLRCMDREPTRKEIGGRRGIKPAHEKSMRKERTDWGICVNVLFPWYVRHAFFIVDTISCSI